MVLPASVICEPTVFNFFKSGFSYLSSVQNYLWSLADRSIASSTKDTWLSNLIVSTKSVSDYSLSYKF